MDKNAIILREVGNDGRSIFLYYDGMAGVYLAYGLSAYYTTMVTEPFMSYSEEMRMPVALLRRDNINKMRQSLKKLEHTVKEFYKFQLKSTIGEAGYDKWAASVLKRHLNIRT